MILFFYEDFIFFIHEREQREAETREAGSMQEARYETWFRDSELKADTQPLSHPGIPQLVFLYSLGKYLIVQLLDHKVIYF